MCSFNSQWLSGGHSDSGVRANKKRSANMGLLFVQWFQMVANMQRTLGAPFLAQGVLSEVAGLNESADPESGPGVRKNGHHRWDHNFRLSVEPAQIVHHWSQRWEGGQVQGQNHNPRNGWYANTIAISSRRIQKRPCGSESRLPRHHLWHGK